MEQDQPQEKPQHGSPWADRPAGMDDDQGTAERFITGARSPQGHDTEPGPGGDGGRQTLFAEAEDRMVHADPRIYAAVNADQPGATPADERGPGDDSMTSTAERRYMGVPGLVMPDETPTTETPTTDGAGVAQDDTAGERCPACGGVIPSDHELLTEVLGWLAPAGEDFVHQFYIDLFRARPDLRGLFPKDIKIQEEKLLTAIIALLKSFKASDAEMEQLNSALAGFGRSHTRFAPAATIEEYAAVWTVLAGVAVRMLGDKLTDRHVAALRRAYEYGAGMMLAAQATAKLSGVGRRRRTV